jgi:amino acid transporter
MIGLRIGKWVQNIGGISTWIPGIIVIALGAAYFVTRGSATPFHMEALIPKLNLDTWTFWSYICFAFAGFELVTLMGGEIKDYERNIPRSIVVGGIIATVMYVVGTIALIVSLPSEKISLISGVLQAIGEQGRVFHIPLMVNVLAILLIFGQCGAVGAWMSGSGRVLYSVGVDRYLPSVFSRIHPRWSTPHISILIQGIVCTLFMIISAAGATAREYWQQLLSATVIVYFIPYLYLFIAYFNFMQRKQMPRTFAGYASCVLGFFATAVSIVISVYPPEPSGQFLYVSKIIGGTLITIAIPIFLYYRARKADVIPRDAG